jgi:hypothetical protein
MCIPGPSLPFSMPISSKSIGRFLSRKKFHLHPLDIEVALQVIQDYGLNVERTEVKDEVFPDPQ